ncbi:MAG: PD40 domain-containing protein [Deltaproteobacteria bacterium]|nr:PD40 domain-containing protein [Deltaproteobacteria bacterium]
MRSHAPWIATPIALGLVALPLWVTRAQPVQPPSQPQQVTEIPSMGDITITLAPLERRLMPVAVPTMRGPQGDAVTQVVANDLRLSVLFRVLDPANFTANLETEGLNITPGPWLSVGANAVVKAETSGAGDATRVELRVWEPGRPAAPVLSRTYGPGNPRALGHRIANDLIQQYTRTPGVFGTRIAFSRRSGRLRRDIFTVDCDGQNLAQLTSNRRLSYTPSWGPGGSLYYSSQTPEGFLALFRHGSPGAVVRADGLVMGAAFGGGRMAVMLTRDGNSDIFIGNPDGTGLRNITNNPAIDTSPVFSPDGSRIAFVSDRSGNPQVYVMDLNGGGQRRVSYAGGYNNGPSWSSDGQTIAYAGRTSGGMDIFSINTATGALRRLTEGSGSNSDPSFAPDGRLIAYSSTRGGIYLMNQDGLGQTRILPGVGESLRWEPR